MAIIGLKTLNQKFILEIDANPILNPIDAPIGSIALLDQNGNSQIFIKHGDSSTDWREGFQGDSFFHEDVTLDTSMVDENINSVFLNDTQVVSVVKLHFVAQQQEDQAEVASGIKTYVVRKTNINEYTLQDNFVQVELNQRSPNMSNIDSELLISNNNLILRYWGKASTAIDWSFKIQKNVKIVKI